MLSAAEFADVPAIGRRWAVIEDETRAFVAELADDRLARDLEYTNTQGERWTYPLWQNASGRA
jgi:hypothetical protein